MITTEKSANIVPEVERRLRLLVRWLEERQADNTNDIGEIGISPAEIAKGIAVLKPYAEALARLTTGRSAIRGCRGRPADVGAKGWRAAPIYNWPRGI